MNESVFERMIKSLRGIKEHLYDLVRNPLESPELTDMVDGYRRHGGADTKSQCIKEIRFSREKGAISRETMDFLMKQLG